MDQLTASMSYDYEYVGPYTRVVLTPVTERLHYSLVTAISLQQTLAVTGPANSGKFQTVKDYANVSPDSCNFTWLF